MWYCFLQSPQIFQFYPEKGKNDRSSIPPISFKSLEISTPNVRPLVSSTSLNSVETVSSVNSRGSIQFFIFVSFWARLSRHLRPVNTKEAEMWWNSVNLYSFTNNISWVTTESNISRSVVARSAVSCVLLKIFERNTKTKCARMNKI